MGANDVLALALGVTPPWKLVGQRLDTSTQPNQLHIEIAAERGALFPCPVCGKASKVNATLHLTQHLDGHDRCAVVTLCSDEVSVPSNSGERNSENPDRGWREERGDLVLRNQRQGWDEPPGSGSSSLRGSGAAGAYPFPPNAGSASLPRPAGIGGASALAGRPFTSFAGTM